MFVEHDEYLPVSHKPRRGGMLDSRMRRETQHMPLLRSSEEWRMFFMTFYTHATPPGFKRLPN